MRLHFDPATGTDFFSDDQGAEYRTGLMPGAPAADAPLAASLGFPLIPRSDIRDINLWELDPQVWNQNPYNSCAGHGAVAAVSLAYHLGGAKSLRLSPTYVYGNIIADKNRGDNGARLDETLREVTERGVCSENLVGRGQIYRRSWANRAAADKEAELYKVAEWLLVKTFDEMLTLISLAFPISFGISLGQRFSPGPGGVIPDRSGGGGGHAMAAAAIRRIGGRLYVGSKNSWGPDWADGGYCWMPESYFTAGDMNAYGGVWVPLVVTTDPKSDPTIS
jgi:hypothetical protein